MIIVNNIIPTLEAFIPFIVNYLSFPFCLLIIVCFIGLIWTIISER